MRSPGLGAAPNVSPATKPATQIDNNFGQAENGFRVITRRRIACFIRGESRIARGGSLTRQRRAPSRFSVALTSGAILTLQILSSSNLQTQTQPSAANEKFVRG